MEWYLAALKKYAVFDGRSKRKEYWYFVLFNVFIFLTLLIVGLAIGAALTDTGSDSFAIVAIAPITLYGLAIFIPSAAVTVRRLHDVGLSGWLYLLNFLPFGQIVLLVFAFMDSKPGTNQYGPDPKAGERSSSVAPPAVTQ